MEQGNPAPNKKPKSRRCAHRIALTALLFTTLWAVVILAPGLLDPESHSAERKARDRKWVNTSPYFVDRQLCRWFTLCGLHHVRSDPASRSYLEETHSDEDELRLELRRRATNAAGSSDQETKPSVVSNIPDYVLKHAPLVHLYSGEQFWPSDITAHLQHMNITTNTTTSPLPPPPTTPWTLDNLRSLNDINATVFLQSKQDVEQRPDWLHSAANMPTNFTSIPDRAQQHQPRHPHAKPPPTQPTPPLLPRGHKPDGEGYSPAPAILVLVDKGAGILDAFWFFFYSYNLGQTVLGMRFGNHVGDWEHCMVRFEHGLPRGAFLSAHSGGHAYAWDALHKHDNGTRPVIYSAVGSHAMYATPGDHPYVLPFGLLKDQTDDGPVWDPALNRLAYFYDFAADDEDTTFPERKKNRTGTDDDGEPFHPPPVQLPEDTPQEMQVDMSPGKQETLVPASSNPDAPTSWFHYKGYWGDQVYPLADDRQWRLFGQYHYVTGPSGPKFKKLGRSQMCPRKKCTILHELDRLSTWY